MTKQEIIMYGINYPKGGAMYLLSQGASVKRNFFFYLDDGIVKTKNGYREKKITIKQGDVAAIETKDGQARNVLVYGVFQKTYSDGKLIKERYFSEGKRMVKEGLYSREKKGNFCIEKYAKNFSHKEEVVYWLVNGRKRLMYKFKNGSKSVNIYNQKGKIIAQMLHYGGGFKQDSFSSNPRFNLDRIRNGSFRDMGDWKYFVWENNEIVLWIQGKGAIPEAGERNGQRLYFIKGIEVSKNIAEGNYTAKDIMATQNVTIRSELIKTYGIERMFNELNARVVEKANGYTLMEIRNPNGTTINQVIRALQMTCPSTKQTHVIRVHPDVKTVQEALNWTYGEVEELEIIDAS
jgi:hypothetical protein